MFFIVDADVLIDYVSADLGMLAAVSRVVGQIHVAAAIVEEVDGLDREKCAAHGLIVVEGTLELLQRASKERGRLSFEDHVCLQLAIEHSWICISNDRALRTACGDEGVQLRWGLQIMLDLLRVDGARLDDAIAAATTIHENNRTHVTRAILDDFVQQARAVARPTTVTS